MAGRRDSALRIVPAPDAKPAEVTGYETGGTGLDFGEVPDLLDTVGRTEWERMGRVYEGQPTRFREGDRAAMIAYCVYWSAFLTAAFDVGERGPVVEGRSDRDRGRMVKNPATVAQREASTQLRYWARELGLTPDARGRMGLTDGLKEIKDDDNPYA